MEIITSPEFSIAYFTIGTWQFEADDETGEICLIEPPGLDAITVDDLTELVRQIKMWRDRRIVYKAKNNPAKSMLGE